MAWRLQLANRPIHRLDILAGKPQILAAWTQPHQIHYFELFSGTKIDHRNFEEPEESDRKSQAWLNYCKSLTAPNNVPLPYVRVRNTAVYTTENGQMRLFIEGGSIFTLESGGRSSRLIIEPEVSIVASGMDRSLGLIALLDQSARLHLYQQHIRVGIFETPLVLNDETTPVLMVPRSGYIFVGDSRQILIVEPTGKIRARYDAHYPIGTACCSPDGRLIALTDLDTDVIRVYETAGFVLKHQRFAIDLLADSRRLQLLPTTGAGGGTVGAAALTDKGTLAFTTAGIICVTNLAKMKAVGASPDTGSVRATAPNKQNE